MNPIASNLALIDQEQISCFLDMLFRYVDGEYAMMLRGIGEAGTTQEGRFQENVSVQLGSDSWHAVERTLEVARRWGQHHIATYIVPAAMDMSILRDNKGTEDRVRLFTAICVDLDRGNPMESYRWLSQHICEPTMVVESGGIANGKAVNPKLHLWWALSDPVDDVKAVGRYREMLALRARGDPSFKRIAQVIRVPGTVYAKGGVARQCRIVSYNPLREMHW